MTVGKINAAKSSPEQLKCVKAPLQPMLRYEEDSRNFNPFQTKQAIQNSLTPQAIVGPIVNDDKFDDPNSNLFERKVKMQNSSTLLGNGLTIFNIYNLEAMISSRSAPNYLLIKSTAVYLWPSFSTNQKLNLNTYNY